jgi:hypothetical protein
MNALTKSVKNLDDAIEEAAKGSSCRLLFAIAVETAPAGMTVLVSAFGICGIPNNGLPSGHPKQATTQDHLV